MLEGKDDFVGSAQIDEAQRHVNRLPAPVDPGANTKLRRGLVEASKLHGVLPMPGAGAPGDPRLSAMRQSFTCPATRPPPAGAAPSRRAGNGRCSRQGS